MTPGQEDFAAEDLRRAEQALKDARLLHGADARESATSRLYYAAFHAVRASLIVRGTHAKTHSGLIHRYEQTFGPTPLLRHLFDLRAAADYGKEPFAATTEEIGRLIEEVFALLKHCRDLVTETARNGPDEEDPPPDL